MIEVGILKNFDSGTYRAGVQLAGSLTTYFDDVSVAKNIPSSAMVIGNYVIVAIPGGNPRDACVIATWPQGSPGGGAFVDLSDTPSSYSGQAGKILKVKTDETAIEFAAMEKTFYALDDPKLIYRLNAVSDSPRTATIDGVGSDVITLTDNHAYRFFYSALEGNVYVKISNTSKNPSGYAWVKAIPAANQLQVTDSADISGWANGETLSTAEDGATSDAIEVDLSLLIPEGATGVFISMEVRDSGTIASKEGALKVGPDPSERFQFVYCQVTDLVIAGYPFTPVDGNRHLFFADMASGIDTLKAWVKLAAYVR